MDLPDKVDRYGLCVVNLDGVLTDNFEILKIMCHFVTKNSKKGLKF